MLNAYNDYKHCDLVNYLELMAPYADNPIHPIYQKNKEKFTKALLILESYSKYAHLLNRI